MSAGYDPQSWQAFYSLIGSAAATLTGLLAVALSIKPERIMGTPTHAARSREALAGFLVLIVTSILMLIPGQNPAELGIELFSVGFVVLVAAVFYSVEPSAAFMRRSGGLGFFGWHSSTPLQSLG